jgi:hypothetical protein
MYATGLRIFPINDFFHPESITTAKRYSCRNFRKAFHGRDLFWRRGNRGRDGRRNIDPLLLFLGRSALPIQVVERGLPGVCAGGEEEEDQRGFEDIDRKNSSTPTRKRSMNLFPSAPASRRYWIKGDIKISLVDTNPWRNDGTKSNFQNSPVVDSPLAFGPFFAFPGGLRGRSSPVGQTGSVG